MIGGKIIDDNGEILEQYKQLNKSSYQPPEDVKKLFARVQADYQTAYSLQHRSFQEFDGKSLLERANLDQQTFAAYVGDEFLPAHKRWRFRGRKNTSRNKIIGILSHMIAGMLYPSVHAKNESNEEDAMTARVMRILVEEHLKKAKYELNFLYMCLSALVNPAVFVEIEWVEAIQRIKKQLKDGTYTSIEAVDELLSGMNINLPQVGEILLPDFYSGTGKLQNLPFLLRVRRIPYDQARSIYSSKYYDENGKDLFGYVNPGMTQVLLAGQENATLFDVEWSEADENYVQEITAFYRQDDLELTWVGGVGMFNYKDPINSNPLKHRRFTLVNGEWMTIPVYPFAMSGFEPIDPSGRFVYFKSASFKEFWDDMALNTMHRLVLDGTYLDVIKPMFLSGVAKADSVVLAPGATIGMPQGSTVTPFQMGPNLPMAYKAISQQQSDLSESTQDKISNGVTDPNVTAFATQQALNQARLILGVFGTMIADLVRQVGELTMDCVVNYSTVGQLDATVPESLKMKYKTFLSRGKDSGKSITNRVIFTDRNMGKKMDESQVEDYEWGLYEKAGGYKSDQRIYEVNPYQFARYTYTLEIDPDQIVQKSMGMRRQEKMLAFQMMTDPRVLQFTDAEAVVDDFVINEFGGDDPDKYKRKGQMPLPQVGGVVNSGQSVKSPVQLPNQVMQ